MESVYVVVGRRRCRAEKARKDLWESCGICYLVSVPVDSYSGGRWRWLPEKAYYFPTTSNLRLDVADSCFDAVLPYKKTSKAVAIACLVLGNTSPMKPSSFSPHI
eukprot:scaffold4858_cov106-Skeletonema_marinoi.AAC.1